MAYKSILLLLLLLVLVRSSYQIITCRVTCQISNYLTLEFTCPCTSGISSTAQVDNLECDFASLYDCAMVNYMYNNDQETYLRSWLLDRNLCDLLYYLCTKLGLEIDGMGDETGKFYSLAITHLRRAKLPTV